MVGRHFSYERLQLQWETTESHRAGGHDRCREMGDGWMDMQGNGHGPASPDESRLRHTLQQLAGTVLFLEGTVLFSIHAECNVQKSSLIKFFSVMMLLLRGENDAPYNIFSHV